MNKLKTWVVALMALTGVGCQEIPEKYQLSKAEITTEITNAFEETSGKEIVLYTEEFDEAMKAEKQYDALYNLRKLYRVYKEEYAATGRLKKDSTGLDTREEYALHMIGRYMDQFRQQYGDEKSIAAMMESIAQWDYPNDWSVALNDQLYSFVQNVYI